jgi:hypothetical protein
MRITMVRIWLVAAAIVGTLWGCSGRQAEPTPMLQPVPSLPSATPGSKLGSPMVKAPPSSQATSPSQTPTPSQAPTSTNSAPAPANPPAAAKTVSPAQVKLVPFPKEKWPVRCELLVPEGWSSNGGLAGDYFQTSSGDVSIRIHTFQYRDKPAPRTVEEMRKSMGESDTDTSVREIKINGAPLTFEVKFSQVVNNQSITSLSIASYGKTLQEWLSLEAPSAQFPQWEPVFRQIIASYQPSNLNEAPFGRP